MGTINYQRLIKEGMFYLTKRIDEKQCTVGERCMVLVDFSGIPAGLKGTVTDVYNGGVMIQWDTQKLDDGFNRIRGGDGFGREELEYLAFETEKHPKVD